MAHTSKSFPQFSHLPPELRLDIIDIVIEDAVKAREEWHRNRGSSDTIVVRPCPLGLRMKPPHESPPSLAELACVSSEWQHEMEKRLFKSLRLASPRGRGSVSDLIAFSAVVTGARRRYLRKLELDSCNTLLSSNRLIGDEIVGYYPKGCSFKSVMDLFRTLGTWAPVQDAGVSLTVKLNIELQDLPLQHFKEHIENLPMVPIVGDLHINMNPRKFSKSPPALPFLLRKLPRLNCATLKLSPWYFSRAQGGNEEDSEVQAFADDLCSAIPLLESLTLEIPRVSRGNPSWMLYSNILGGRFFSSIRELSYRLKFLELITPVDMSLFFEHFAHETKGRKLVTYPSWPNLQSLQLQGSITKREGAEAGQPEDQFLRRVGRATRFMPKLRFLEIEVKPTLTEDLNQMVFWLNRESYSAGRGHVEVEEFNLWVMNNTPSSSAVSAWRDAALHTKRGHLGVHFMPAVSFDEDDEEIDDEEIDGEEIDGWEIDGGEIDGGEIDGGEIDGGEIDGEEGDGEEGDGEEIYREWQTWGE